MDLDGEFGGVVATAEDELINAAVQLYTDEKLFNAVRLSTRPPLPRRDAVPLMYVQMFRLQSSVKRRYLCALALRQTHRS